MSNLLDTSFANLFDPGTVLGALLYALMFLILALLAARTVRLFVMRYAKYFPDLTAIHFIAQLTQVAVFLVALILYAQLVPALRSFGAALLTGVSIASIIIGLASQNTLGNAIAGISLLLYRPFQVGDQIQLNTPKDLQTGTIESLTLGYTIIRSSDGEKIIVPNSVMASAVIIKLTPQDRA